MTLPMLEVNRRQENHAVGPRGEITAYGFQLLCCHNARIPAFLLGNLQSTNEIS